MTKISRRKLEPEKYGQYLNNLWSAFTLAGSKEDIRLLFQDLFTPTEYKMFAKRFQIARCLLEDEHYESIDRELKVTSHTIAKVSNTLALKGEGLRKAHESLRRMEKKRAREKSEREPTWKNAMKRKIFRRTAGGALVRLGLNALDKKITLGLKRRTAKKTLAA